MARFYWFYIYLELELTRPSQSGSASVLYQCIKPYISSNTYQQPQPVSLFMFYIQPCKEIEQNDN